MSNKQEYQDKMHAQIDEWSARIDLLKAKAKKADAEAKSRYLETVEELEEKKLAAKGKLREIEKAGDEAWEDLKAGFEASWNNLKDAVDSAMSRFGG